MYTHVHGWFQPLLFSVTIGVTPWFQAVHGSPNASHWMATHVFDNLWRGFQRTGVPPWT